MVVPQSRDDTPLLLKNHYKSDSPPIVLLWLLISKTVINCSGLSAFSQHLCHYNIPTWDRSRFYMMFISMVKQMHLQYSEGLVI